MGWRMIGKPILTADLPFAVSQKVELDAAKVLRGIQVGVILYGDPAFTSLEARIYTDNAGTPKKLIATSTNAPLKAAILEVEDHGMKFMGFSFNYVNLLANTPYHFVLYPNGYTGTDASHIAWRMSYPDPQYRTGITLDAAHGDNHPLELSLVGEIA